ncbi:MAG: Gfo/Idh/MocA family protein [Anaerolineae bacterium]
MAQPFRVGIVGFGHMHVNSLAAQYAAHPLVELVACADTVPARPERVTAPYTRAWNLQHVTSTLGSAQVYDDYRQMLARERLGVVLVTCENARHGEVVEACAAAGAHVCVEKPMAASLSDALRMARAAREAGVTLVVNWPITWSGAARRAVSLVAEGAVGRVLQVKWRGGHTGPLGPRAMHAGVDREAEPLTGPERGATWWHQAAEGGGAMLDYCCYGALVARWLLGQPAEAALGMRANLHSRWGDADDNAAMLVRFPEAMAMIEGSWTTLDHGVPSGPIVYGTQGTLVVETSEGGERVRIERGAGQRELFDPEPLPDGRTNVAEELLYHLHTGEPLHPTLALDLNLEAMAILDAGLRSTDSGRQELVGSATWCIG